MANRNRLFFDIETSMNVGVFFQPGHQVSINHDQIVEERKIICICYKWEHSKKVYSLQWDSKKCDKKMLKDFIKVADQADELVGHNGDRFDITWVRTRALIHGIPFTPYIVSIDTLKLSRSLFKFNSNRLDYVTKLLLGEGKSQTNFQMWKDLTLLPYTKTKPTLNKMVKYCKRDVQILQDYFEKINPYIKHKTHYAVKGECPECGSDKLRITRRRMNASGTCTVQLNCDECSKYHTMPEKQFNKIQNAKLV